MDGGAHAVHGVQNGGVIAPADAAPDLRKTVLGELAGEVHRDLTGRCDGRAAIARQERGSLDPELLRCGVEDLPDAAGILGGVLAEPVQNVTYEHRRSRFALE